jgi:hypothetical protein
VPVSGARDVIPADVFRNPIQSKGSSMKTLWLFALACFGVAGVVRADPVIKFDDLPSAGVVVPSGYHLLNWSNLYYLDGVSYPLSGYNSAVVSSNNVLFGGAGLSPGVISAGMFDFLSAYATAGWNDGLVFEAKGYVRGALVYDRTNILSATARTLVNFNFYGVDEVDLLSSGGTPHASYTNNGSGAYFALDNVSVVTYVPYAPPLVTNGGFETGDLSGWGHFGNTNFTYVTNMAGGNSYAHSGSFGVLIGPETTPGYLGQTMPTEVGEMYSISCWLENPVPGIGANDFAVYWSGISVLNLTNLPVFAWTNFQFNLPASRLSTFLEFQFVNDPAFFGFDDVSVTSVPRLTNNGFELGSFAGWTQSGNIPDDHVTNLAIAVRSGAFGAEFGSDLSPGYISQTVNTYPGQPYLVSCWLDSPDGGTPNEFIASWGGKTVTELTNMTAFGWTNLHFTVMSSSAQTTLQFGLRDDPAYLGLDDISVIPVPILQNGGFEFGDFTGWTTSGNFTFSSVSTNTSYALSGFYGGAFGPTTTLGYLSQTVPTIPGQAYLIGFSLDAPDVLTNNNAEFKASWNGTVLMDQTYFLGFGWGSYQFLVSATGTNSTLQFGFRDDPYFLGLDDVSVSAISAPVFQSINKTSNRVDLAWSALPGYLYALQYTTNLVHPNWTNLSFQFPTSFTITATDTNPPNPERFYRVQMEIPLE